MPSLKTNIVANLLGGISIAILTIAITPLQVQLLGIEAYGLVGLIAVLQVALGALDLGLSATITRTVSADHTEGNEASLEFVNSAATLYWLLAILIAALLWFNADRVAAHWLKPSSLDPASVTLEIQIISVYLALRWPVAFYTGIISGLQRLDILNLIKSGITSARLFGGIIVLVVAPELGAFLLWYLFTAVIELGVFAWASYRLMPGLRMRLYFSFDSMRRVWRFSAAMGFIALMSMMLTQIDRLMVSGMLTLESLGYYTLAYNTAIGISLVQSAINGASLPAFSGDHGRQRPEELLSRYNKTSQLMGYVTALPCFVLVFFGHDILAVWISPVAADGASVAMALLAIGFFLNAMVSNCYIMAVARGQPKLPLKVNLIGLVVYVPALYWLIGAIGVNGAAVCWSVLNLYYMFALFPLVQIGLLGQKAWPWLVQNFFPFLIAGLVAFGGFKALSMNLPYDWVAWPAMVAAGAVYALLGYFVLASGLRTDMRAVARKFGMRYPVNRA